MRTFYVVSGYMRSGTSMMMKALESGGLCAAFKSDRDKMNKQYGDEDYKPNPGGFYELEKSDYLNLDFPENIEGNLFKCLYGGITRLSKGDYNIVFMMRDPEEIRQSYDAFFNQEPPGIANYDKIMKKVIGILEMRRDVKLTILNYRDVVNNPSVEFGKLSGAGWPIDVEKCISVVDPSLCRFRKEILIPGA